MNLKEALEELLGAQASEIDESALVEDREKLVAAAVEAWRRRHVNTLAGAQVIAALADSGLSYRQIADLTGIPSATAHRWARPPADG
ncbi:helix-turn-helix domain-containing protein [Actinocorallia sp. A-T 12471]|uniref:helix-turn-helix domain-containing protein n=1 Tax=Actinocorallia sp. A-T 12471 TaxID=3089813 RepID=UPI0029D2ED8F|nr:helix-turn-helix domain-containing protein [Actinocorallia sp. A-T 12471]MDX6744620.1 helix-turn-helix domain-containing protein [Actinocorallia sp. A-T 12471]